MNRTPHMDPQVPAATLSPDENRRMFDAIAGRYDLLNRLMSLGQDRRWRRQAVETLRASVPPSARPPRILDVGCGTGDVVIELARQFPAAAVVGLDHAESMLVAGREKVNHAGCAQGVSLQAGSATAMNFPDCSFDGAITAFCFRNLDDRPAFLSEACRVLRLGCPLVILELTRPRAPLHRAAHRLYNAAVLPLLGRLLSQGSAYRYLFRSIERFPAQEEILALMEQAGFAAPRWRPLSGGVVSVFQAVKTKA